MRKTLRLEVRLDPRTKERLEIYAADHGTTLSGAIDMLIWNARVSKKMRREPTEKEMRDYLGF